MSSDDRLGAESLRARTRRAVASELLDISQDLFAECGYDAVTVEQIAKAAGMSRRSFFRYFPSKDALVLGKYDRQGDLFVAALAARPRAEATWQALRRMFDDVVDYMSDPVRGPRAVEMDRVINSSDTLRAGYLERLERAQLLVTQTAIERSEGRIDPFDAATVVASAFAVFSSSVAHSRRTGEPLAGLLDRGMEVIGPRTADLES